MSNAPLENDRPSHTLWIGLAFAAAAITLGGSLFLTWGMSLQACPLCFYQRAFAMSLVGVLGIGLLAGPQQARLGLLALPLAIAGLGVALFHVSLEASGKLECPSGIFGLGSAPQQSLAMFVVLTGLLLADVLGTRKHLLALSAGVILGALLAAASSTSNPPMKKPPPEVYEKPPLVCRPPQ